MHHFLEKPSSERKPSTLVREDSRPEARESYELDADGDEHARDDFTVDGDYVKVPGDPYPYSREHFQKWRMAQRDIPIGRTYDRADFLSNPSSSDTDTTADMEMPQSRKMSHDARAATLPPPHGEAIPNIGLTNN